jgi:CRP-like cAMP-binding protein
MATYQPGETIIEEGSPATCLVFIIIEGEAAVCKRGQSPLTGRPFDYEIEVRGKSASCWFIVGRVQLPAPGRDGALPEER